MSGLAALGTKLRVGSTPVLIANLTNIVTPDGSVEMLDVTAHDSAGGYREQVPSFIKWGSAKFDFNFDGTETTHKDVAGGLFYIFKNKTLEDWEIEFPDGVITMSFQAYISKPPVISAPYEGVLTASCEIEVSGGVTWAYA